jgi:hypothetical protein
MASVTSLTQGIEGSAPITRFFPVASQAWSIFTTSFLAIGKASLAVLSYITYSILLLSPLPLVLYVLSPALVLGQILLDVLIFTPYNAVSSLAGIMYPLYVLLGIACLIGAAMGVSGRQLVRMLNDAVYPPPNGNGQKEVLKRQIKGEKKQPTRRRSRMKLET